jgi:hypothetical protein
MRTWPLLCFLALAGLNSGCSFFYWSCRNLVEAPWKECNHCCERREFAALAHDAWQHVRAADPGHPYSEDYEAGFIDGYVDYLDYDGLGEPPAAPPDRYQAARYRNAEGQRAVEAWFAGFRHGAATARASGQREQVVIPLGLPPRRVDPIEKAAAGGIEVPPDVQVPAEPIPVPPRLVPDGKASASPTSPAETSR